MFRSAIQLTLQLARNRKLNNFAAGTIMLIVNMLIHLIFHMSKQNIFLRCSRYEISNNGYEIFVFVLFFIKFVYRVLVAVSQMTRQFSILAAEMFFSQLSKFMQNMIWELNKLTSKLYFYILVWRNNVESADFSFSYNSL